ncbi:MAG: gamma carbonic anhydrase family protein [Gammaproteobacteria bacterium]|nr:gamma carbonic anhydrase family protein [Gammaproteobacteria bacterium]
MSVREFENHTPDIAPSAYIDPLALVIGDVTIGEDASLWPFVAARGDIQSIRIGARSNVQDGSVLHVTHAGRFCPGGRPLIIGEDVIIGHKVTLHACTIEHHCLIGIGAIVLDGAILKPYTLLGAGSLVPPGKVLEGGFLWRGSPAKKARPLTSDEMDFFAYSADYYVKLAQRHAGIINY